MVEPDCGVGLRCGQAWFSSLMLPDLVSAFGRARLDFSLCVGGLGALAVELWHVLAPLPFRASSAGLMHMQVLGVAGLAASMQLWSAVAAAERVQCSRSMLATSTDQVLVAAIVFKRATLGGGVHVWIVCICL